MKAVIHINHSEHQKIHGNAIKEGLERHGIKTQLAGRDDPQDCDFAVIWGWRQRRVINAGRPVLVMERGYVGDRFEWTSMGWNGLNGRATFADIADSGERWNGLFNDYLQPWKEDGSYTLVCGQVPGDASLHGVNIHHWAQKTCDALDGTVIFRPHPKARGRSPSGYASSTCSLAEDLNGAERVVTYNSNSGVDAVLAGVPTVTCDEGAMAWDVSSHDLETVIRPDRSEWCRRLAWSQFSIDEIKSGLAWEAVKTCSSL